MNEIIATKIMGWREMNCVEPFEPAARVDHAFLALEAWCVARHRREQTAWYAILAPDWYTHTLYVVTLFVRDADKTMEYIGKFQHLPQAICEALLNFIDQLDTAPEV